MEVCDWALGRRVERVQRKQLQPVDLEGGFCFRRLVGRNGNFEAYRKVFLGSDEGFVSGAGLRVFRCRVQCLGCRVEGVGIERVQREQLEPVDLEEGSF